MNQATCHHPPLHDVRIMKNATLIELGFILLTTVILQVYRKIMNILVHDKQLY